MSQLESIYIPTPIISYVVLLKPTQFNHQSSPYIFTRPSDFATLQEGN